LRPRTKIAIPPKQIERIEQQPILMASRKLCLQLGEIGAPFVNDDDPAIDDRLAGNVEGAWSRSA
jgi:hypothetical protein